MNIENKEKFPQTDRKISKLKISNAYCAHILGINTICSGLKKVRYLYNGIRPKFAKKFRNPIGQ